MDNKNKYKIQIASELDYERLCLMGLANRLSSSARYFKARKNLPNDEIAFSDLHKKISETLRKTENIQNDLLTVMDLSNKVIEFKDNIMEIETYRNEEEDSGLFWPNGIFAEKMVFRKDGIFKQVGIDDDDYFCRAFEYILTINLYKDENILYILSIWCCLLVDLCSIGIEEIRNKESIAWDGILWRVLMLHNMARETITRSYEAIGYWTAKSEPKIKAVNNQGALSREIGELTRREAEIILEKYGGIDGYMALGYGQKKPITDEIEKKLKLKDKRHVYNIIKMIKEIKNIND